MSSNLKKIFGFAIGFFFLWLAFRKIDLSKIPSLIAQIYPKALLLCIVSLTFEHLTRAFRWKVILHSREIRFFHLYVGVVVGYLFNNLFPARAGEFVRAFYLNRRSNTRASEAFGSIVLERFLDGVVVISIILLAFLLFPLGQEFQIACFLAVLFYAVVLAFIIVLQFKVSWFDAILKVIVYPLSEKWREKVFSLKLSFTEGFSLVKQPSLFLTALLLSYFSWGISIFTVWLSFGIFDLNLGPSAAILLLAILSLGAMLPASPGMIGFFEWACIFALSDFLSVSREVAGAYGLFFHFVIFIYVLIIGYGLMIFDNLSMGELRNPQVAS
ncbi:flippase-like domain-containing protein [bacterium]|nr:flippase-like domain-containing protein [bacterium]